LAPLLGNNRRKIELMNGLLCALPGTPVIYYGDEIGMGDNIYLGDRHGVRTPMQWSPDRNAGFSDANPQQLYSPVIIDSEYLFETVNVETQQKNPTSLLWWMKRLIALRQHYPALRHGTIEILAPENSKILAFTRDHLDQSVLMVANLSRFTQFVELDLSRFSGRTPIEMFGQTRFPGIGKTPYFLTLAPHSFYWFSLVQETSEATAPAIGTLDLSEISAVNGAAEGRRTRMRKNLETVLARELPRLRWLIGPARRIQALHVADAVALARHPGENVPYALILRIDYLEGEEEHYLLPLAAAWGGDAERLAQSVRPPAVVASLKHPQRHEDGVVYDASSDPPTVKALLDLMTHRRRFKGRAGEMIGWSSPAAAETLAAIEREATPGALVRTECPDNACVSFGDKAVLKVFRRLERGINPELEFGRYLTNHGFEHALPLLGAVEYRPAEGEPQTVAVLHGNLPNSASGWQFAHDSLLRFFETVMAQPAMTLPVAQGVSLWELAGGSAPQEAQDLLGADLEWAGSLGKRVGELHAALALDRAESAFSPEPFSQLYQRSLYQSWRKLALQTLQHLRRHARSLPEPAQGLALAVLQNESRVLEIFRQVVGATMGGSRIRCHGDLTLHHVLYTGKDFLIVDFEGKPHRSIVARRTKRSPLCDVAATLHSFQAAAAVSARQLPTFAAGTPETIASGQQAATFWHVWCSSSFLRSYLSVPGAQSLLPTSPEQRQTLLKFHLMAEAIDELELTLSTDAERTAGLLSRVLELAGA
jgi:maltose alpha-D-glucosyltransferase/alpha-amylase